MLEKIIELTNLYIDSMPKKERNTGSFLQVWKRQGSWQTRMAKIVESIFMYHGKRKYGLLNCQSI